MDEPWTARWPALKRAFTLVRAHGSSPADAPAEVLTELGGNPAFEDFTTPGVSDMERGRWLAELIGRVARRVERQFSSAPESPAGKAARYWAQYLTCGSSTLEISRRSGHPNPGSKSAQHDVEYLMWFKPTRQGRRGAEPAVRALAEGVVAEVERFARTLRPGSAGEALTSLPTHLEILESDGSPALDILALLCFAAPDEPVPRVFLEFWERMPLDHREAFMPDRLEGELALLVERRLVDATDEGVTIGEALQAEVRARLDPHACARWIDAFMGVLWERLPADSHEPVTRCAWSLALPHVLAVVGYAERLDVEADHRCWMLDRASVHVREFLSPAAAVPLSERATRLVDDGADPIRDVISVPRANLGLALMKAERLDEADRVFRAVLDEEERLFGDCWQLAETLSLYGDLLKRRNRVRDAIAVQQRAVDILRADAPDENAIAVGLNELAVTLAYAGRHRKAIKLQEEGLTLATEGAAKGAIRRNLALDLAHVGDLDGASRLLWEALAVDEAVYGENSYQVEQTCALLYRVLKDLGDPDAAQIWDRLEHLERLPRPELDEDELR